MRSERKLRERADRLTAVMAHVWPDGVPEIEGELASRLSRDMREKVANRLFAVTEWTSGDRERLPTVIAAAAAAGVSEPRFYALASGWRKKRSIAALGARAAEKPQRGTSLDPTVRQKAVDLVRQTVAADPRTTPSQLMRLFKNSDLPPVSESLIRRLLAQERRTIPPDAFGAELVFDSVGVDAFHGESRMRIFMVLDRGTGLVLGWEYGLNKHRSFGFVLAARDALHRFEILDLSAFEPASGPLSVTINVPHLDVEAGEDTLERRLRSRSIPTKIEQGRVGRDAVKALGERLGSIWIGTGERDDDVSYRYGKVMRMPAYSGNLLREVAGAIDSYNLARMQAAASSSGKGAERRRSFVRRALLAMTAS